MPRISKKMQRKKDTHPTTIYSYNTHKDRRQSIMYDAFQIPVKTSPNENII